MKKNHLEGNDYPCHRRIKKDAKRLSSKKTRRIAERNLKKVCDETREMC